MAGNELKKTGITIENDKITWFDPDYTAKECTEAVCALCFGLMITPTSGCRECHSFCKTCLLTEVNIRKKCPLCRVFIDPAQSLVFNRQLEAMISREEVLCPHGQTRDQRREWHAEKINATKRVKPELAESYSLEELKVELKARGVSHSGTKETMIDRLNADRISDFHEERISCRWKGTMANVLAHTKECGWETVSCPNEDCIAKRMRKDMDEHLESCNSRVTCPNDGCNVLYPPWTMNIHRLQCAFEPAKCPFPGCEELMTRNKLNMHIIDDHTDNSDKTPLKLLIKLWEEKNIQDETSQSEQKLDAASRYKNSSLEDAKTWIFNWKAASWEPGFYSTQDHDFGGGIMGRCSLFEGKSEERPYFMGVKITGSTDCRISATFSMVSSDDAGCEHVYSIGNNNKAVVKNFDDTDYWGSFFKPSEAMKTRCTRQDGSFRLRAVIRLIS